MPRKIAERDPSKPNNANANESQACAYCGEKAWGGIFNQGRRFCNWFCKDWFADHGPKKKGAES